MKRLAVILLILVLVALGAALVVPSFIDWNRYRPEIAARIEAATGRPVAIDGALSFQVLPSPTLSADGVRIANIDGGSTRDMARIGALRVAVDVSALLQGAVRVRSVRVVEPVILLERLDDGRVNWDFPSGGASGRSGGGVAVPMPPSGSGQGGGDGVDTGPDAPTDGSVAGLTVRLDSVRIENGLVVYRDHGGGIETRVRDIALDLSADSLRGPFRAAGEVTARDVAVALDVAVGELAPAGATPVAANLLLPATGDTLTLSGLLHDATEAPRFAGDLSASVSRPADTLAALGQRSAGPVPAGALSLSASLEADSAAATLSDLRLGLGQDEARGQIQARFGADLAVPEVDVTLAVRALDLDALLATLEGGGAAAPSRDEQEPPAGTGDGGKRADGDTGADSDGADSGAGDDRPGAEGFALPTGLAATVDVSAEAVTWRGAVIRKAVLRAALADGHLSIAEAGATLPGASQVTAVAVVRADASGAPTVEGSVRASAGNLREVLDWLRVPVDQVSGDRLRTLDLSANLGGTPSSVRVENLDLTLDTTHATGAAVIALGTRPGLGINLNIDSINLDAYLPGVNNEYDLAPSGPAPSGPAPSGPAPSGPAPSGNGGSPSGPDATPGASPAQGTAPPLLAGLEALNGFDANFRFAVGTLTADALPIAGLRAEGSLVRGRLTLARASIADVAGASVTATGSLSGFGGQARFDDLALSLETGDLARTARVLRLTLPEPARDLGALSQSLVLNGTPQALDVTTRTEADGGTLDASGRILDLQSGRPRFDLSVDARHPAVVSLIRRVAPTYDPAGAPLGAFGLVTRARGTLDQVSLEDLDLSIGSSRLNGQVRLTLDGPRPHVAAGLSANVLPLHAFLPAARQSWRVAPPLEQPRVVPTAALLQARPELERGSSHSALVPVAWSREPIDLSALTLLDGDVNLRAGALIYREHRLENADVSARLADGVLRVERLTGLLHGGQADGTMTVVAANPATYDLSLAVENFSVASLLGLDGPLGAVGTGSMRFEGGSAGATAAALIAALRGQGGLTLTDLDIRAGQVRGTALAGILEPVAALNELAGSLLGGLGASQRLADLESRFAIDQGRLTFDPLRLVSALYEGTLAGDIDLMDWTINADGVADLTDSPLKAALGSIIKLPDQLPVSIAGALDSPSVNIQTAGLPSGAGDLGAQAEEAIRELAPEAEKVIRDVAPEAERILRDVAPGAENMLRGVLGGMSGSAAQSEDGSAGDDAGTEAQGGAGGEADSGGQPEKPTPDAFINDLLRGLGN